MAFFFFSSPRKYQFNHDKAVFFFAMVKSCAATSLRLGKKKKLLIAYLTAEEFFFAAAPRPSRGGDRVSKEDAIDMKFTRSGSATLNCNVHKNC